MSSTLSSTPDVVRSPAQILKKLKWSFLKYKHNSLSTHHQFSNAQDWIVASVYTWLEKKGQLSYYYPTSSVTFSFILF